MNDEYNRILKECNGMIEVAATRCLGLNKDFEISKYLNCSPNAMPDTNNILDDSKYGYYLNLLWKHIVRDFEMCDYAKKFGTMFCIDNTFRCSEEATLVNSNKNLQVKWLRNLYCGVENMSFNRETILKIGDSSFTGYYLNRFKKMIKVTSDEEIKTQLTKFQKLFGIDFEELERFEKSNSFQ